MEQTLLSPFLPTQNKHLYSGNEIPIAPRQFFSVKGLCHVFYGILYTGIQVLWWWHSRADHINTTLWTRPKRQIPDWLRVIRLFCPTLILNCTSFYLLPPVHGTSREKTPKKQFELLPCSWDCLSVPYLHVVQLNIWLVWVVSLWIAVPTFPLPHFPRFVRAATRLIIFCLFQLSYSGWSLNCFLDYISCYLHWMETMCGAMKQREWQLYLFMVCIFQKERIEIALFSSNVEINRPFLKVSY